MAISQAEVDKKLVYGSAKPQPTFGSNQDMGRTVPITYSATDKIFPEKPQKVVVNVLKNEKAGSTDIGDNTYRISKNGYVGGTAKLDSFGNIIDKSFEPDDATPEDENGDKVLSRTFEATLEEELAKVEQNPPLHGYFYRDQNTGVKICWIPGTLD